MGHVAKIINLTSRRKGGTDPARAAVERHWCEIAGGSVPARDALDPSCMAGALDRVFLIERISPRQARIRIAGQRIAALTATEPRGMPLSCLVAPASRDWLGRATEALFDGPNRIELGLVAPRSALRPQVPAELVFLPLLDREGQVSRALAYLTLPERCPAAPIRFEISGENRQPLSIGPAPDLAPASDFDRDFDRADRARTAMRLRQSFQIVTSR